MQLWLREIMTEYAMNKPEGEIWPDTTVIETKQVPDTYPDNVTTEQVDSGRGYQYRGSWVVRIESKQMDGVAMRIDLGRSRTEALKRLDGVTTREIERHRTHCPHCWRKYESWGMLHADINGHMTFLCPADDDWDDRFPRED